MRICKIIVSVAILLLFCRPPAQSAKDAKLIPHIRDPYLEAMMKMLSERNLSPTELEKLSSYIQNHPGDSDGHLVLANAYNKLGMDGMYADELEKAWRLSPNALLYLLASLKVRMISDDPKHFNALVEEAFQKYKNDPNKLQALGTLFQNNQQTAISSRFLSRALELNVIDTSLRASYCTTLLAQQKYKELLTAAKPLQDNKDTATLGNLLEGVAYFRLNMLNKALPLLKDAYTNAPTQPEVAEAYFDALMAAGRQKDSVQPALVSLAMQPLRGTHLDVVKAKIKPVIARVSNTELQSGIAHVSSILPMGQALAYFYFSLGDLLDKSGRYLNAANCFAKGLELDSTFGRAHMRLANDFQILGLDRELGEWHMRQATLLTQDDKEVKAKYLRMQNRIPALDKDIAGKLKLAFNRARYGLN